MKMFVSFVLAVIILLSVPSIVCSASVLPEKEEVVTLIRDWETLYLKYYDKQSFADIMYENGKPKTEKKDYYL